MKTPAEVVPGKVMLVEQTADLRALIAAELAAGKKKIVIPQGRYRVQAAPGGHLLFKDLKDVEIIANHVELVCTSTVQALDFSQCTNVTLRGLTIDYDPLPFTQGSITAMAPDKSWTEFEVATAYPENEFKRRVQIYDPATGDLRRGDADWNKTIEALGGHRYRIRKADGYRFQEAKDTEQVGDILVTNNRFPAGAGGHAVVLTGCENVRLEDITLYASPCFGFLERDCTGSTYLRCKIDRRDPVDDPVKRDQPRMRSLNADAFHSKGAGKGPAIIGCTARFQGDDCVNINGEYHYSSGSRGKLMRIAVLGKPKINAGDLVEFLPYVGSRPEDAVALNIELDPTPITEDEKTLINKLRLNPEIKTGLLTGKADWYTLTLDREIVLPGGSAVCASLRVGNGFVVKDCDFGHNRSRGILIKASKGEVTGNRIINSRMAAVLISPEFWWMEAASSSDVVVKGNFIEGCLQTPIQILARGGNGQPLAAGAHRNISIQGNRIIDSAWPLIRVTSTKGLNIGGNEHPKAPPTWQSVSTHGKILEPIELEQCENVTYSRKP
ncbi:MAG: right-handed parallel beta-helix repeat-containing protein [Akkermansiaceae bacterium]